MTEKDPHGKNAHAPGAKLDAWNALARLDIEIRQEERPHEPKSPPPILPAEPWRGGDLPRDPHS